MKKSISYLITLFILLSLFSFDVSAYTSVLGNGYYYIYNSYANKYFDVKMANTTNNTSILAYAFSSQPNQLWKLAYQNDGTYKIYAQHTTGKVLDVNWADDISDNQICIWDDWEYTSSRFAIANASGYTSEYNILTKNSNFSKVVDIRGGISGERLMEYTLTNQQNQRWKFIRASANEWNYSNYENGSYVPKKGRLVVTGRSEQGGSLASIAQFKLDSNNVDNILFYNNGGENPGTVADNKNCYLTIDMTHVRPSTYDKLSATYIITNLPNPKFDFEDDDLLGSRNEESEITVLGTMVTNQDYYMRTQWADFRDGSAPNGTINLQFAMSEKGVIDYNNVVQAAVVQATHTLGSTNGQP